MTTELLSAAAALFFGLAAGCFLTWWREREQVEYLRKQLAEARSPLASNVAHHPSSRGSQF